MIIIDNLSGMFLIIKHEVGRQEKGHFTVYLQSKMKTTKHTLTYPTIGACSTRLLGFQLLAKKLSTKFTCIRAITRPQP